MARDQVCAHEDGFVADSSSTEWYKNLKRLGSCLRLYDLLEEQRQLIHQLGPEGITVLHKGVQHGCVKLAKFILVDMFDGEGNCTCSLHDGADHPGLTREELLRKTCSYGSTAVNMAVVSGSPKMVLLLKWVIDMSTCKNKELTEEVWSADELRTYRDLERFENEGGDKGDKDLFNDETLKSHFKTNFKELCNRDRKKQPPLAMVVDQLMNLPFNFMPLKMCLQKHLEYVLN